MPPTAKDSGGKVNWKKSPRKILEKKNKTKKSKLISEDRSTEDNKPVPAPRPAYITKPENVKPQRKSPVETNSRKPSSFKRPYSSRVTSTEDSVEKEDKIKQKSQEKEEQHRNAGDTYEEQVLDR